MAATIPLCYENVQPVPVTPLYREQAAAKVAAWSAQLQCDKNMSKHLCAPIADSYISHEWDRTTECHMRRLPAANANIRYAPPAKV